MFLSNRNDIDPVRAIDDTNFGHLHPGARVFFNPLRKLYPNDVAYSRVGMADFTHGIQRDKTRYYLFADADRLVVQSFGAEKISGDSSRQGTEFPNAKTTAIRHVEIQYDGIYSFQSSWHEQDRKIKLNMSSQ